MAEEEGGVMRANLLVELLVEELPPKALRALGVAFAATLVDSLRAQGLADADAPVTPYATPRRLAVHVGHVAAKAADRRVQQKLMPVGVAFDAGGQPSPALLKRLLGLNLVEADVPSLQRRMEGKAENVYAEITVLGATLDAALQVALDDALAKLPIPKVMTYQLADGWSSVQFVRPAHGLVGLHGAQVVRCAALGLNAGRTTQGHRFEAKAATIELRDADAYAEQLERDGAVIAGFDARRDAITRQLRDAAAREGLQPIDDAALLDEVTALVERPNVLVCRFDEQFLAVPPECLILTMKANQKYFPLLDPQGRLTNRFLVVSNIRPDDASRIVQGNERVVRPRLADAKFFFDQDRKRSLESRVPGLDKVVYHAKLGTMGERVRRVQAIAAAIGQRLGGPALAAQAERAARLAKADLLTDMVGEFPELQGVMGGYYARHDGETEAVAFAVEDHYKPRFAGDALPRGDAGVALALADKLETLVGLFGIGQLPTGDKDPFALRRHALGVIRLLVEKALPLDLGALVADASARFGPLLPDARASNAACLQFVYERIAGYLRDQGFGAQETDAVIALRPPWGEIPRRLAAVRSFAELPEAASLAAANKRVGNILKKADGAVRPAVDRALLKEPAEAALADALDAVAPRADAAFARGDYAASLQALAALKAPVDTFFDAVMVNTDDAALRANRLGLLASLHAAMNRVADLSSLAT
jgi:glycyl-tRNA synthetase beta chain